MRNVLRLVAIVLLVPSFAAAGQVFKVGPGGTHATVQEAVTAAVAAGGDNEVRVAVGTFAGVVEVGRGWISGMLQISGGWDAAFATQVHEPGLTVLDGAASGSTVKLSPTGGTVVLRNLTVTGGRATEGGGVLVLGYSDSTATMEISDCTVVGNTAADDAYGGVGGGIAARMGGSARLTISRTTVSRNTTTSSTHAVSAGGMFLNSKGSAQLLVEDCTITGNTGRSGANYVMGVGMHGIVEENAVLKVVGSVVARNVATPGGSGSTTTGVTFVTQDSARADVVRNAFLDNIREGSTPFTNLELNPWHSSSISLSNTVVAGGSGRGVMFIRYADGSIAVSNSTVAGSPQEAFVGSPTSIHNSLIYGNGTDSQIPSSVTAGGNLIGVDPHFVNAALRDYRLLPGSPAIDAGEASPPGGLSETDFTGHARVVGGKVDVGAHEYQGPALLAAGALAHTLGYGDTPWRSDLDLANLGSKQADLTLRYRTASGDQTKPVTLTAGEARGWSDVLVDLFGVGAGDKTSGALEIEDPTGAVVAAVRTYADGGAAGTYGQGYPALQSGAGITSGTVGILPLIKSNTKLYSNVGILNLGGVAVQAKVTLMGPRGTLGSPVTLSADPGRWSQLSDVFVKAGAPSADVAYATIEPLTAGARLWGAASVVDRITRDPTTVEASVPMAAGAVQRVASVAHSSGTGGTAWRSTVAVVNPGSDTANVTLTFRGINTLVRTVKIGAHGVSEWPDVLVDLFNMRPDASVSGSLEVVADRPVAVGCRTYADKGRDGTYGQSYPALTADQCIMAGEMGVLAQLRKTSTAYTNIGALNLSTVPCTASVQLLDAQGQAIGSALKLSPAAGAWTQVTDAFRVAGAGGADAAYARVTVETEGCSMWFYASVIDSLTRDPTTVELARPLVVGPL